MVSAIYDATTTKIQVNGHLTSSIPLGRGVRQGCPLSPTLYVIYVQAFISFITSNLRFQSLPMPGGPVAKLTAYADDLLFFCRDSCDLNLVFNSFDVIKRATTSTSDWLCSSTFYERYI